jgi:glutathione S-transferase
VKLINNGPSPYGRKVMIALREKGIPFEIEWDIPWHKDTTVHHYNPLQQLPILLGENGEVVYESSYILAWLERHYPAPALAPEDPDDVLALRLLQVLSVGIMDAITRINFEMARPVESQSREWMGRQERKIVGAVAEIGRLIGDNAFALGDSFGLADLEVGTVLGHFDFMARNIPALSELLDGRIRWRELHPNLGRYIDALEQRPSFLASTPQMVRMDFQAVVA